MMDAGVGLGPVNNRPQRVSQNPTWFIEGGAQAFITCVTLQS